MNRRSFRVPMLTGAALAAALFSAACSGTRTSAAAPPEPPPVAIQVAEVQAQSIDRFLRVTAAEPDGRAIVRYRAVSSGGSFGASPLAQHIGLGRSARVKSLEDSPVGERNPDVAAASSRRM